MRDNLSPFRTSARLHPVLKSQDFKENTRSLNKLIYYISNRKKNIFKNKENIIMKPTIIKTKEESVVVIVFFFFFGMDHSSSSEIKEILT